MVTINQFKQGFLNYIENDILIHLQGLKKVAVGTTVILMVQNENSTNNYFIKNRWSRETNYRHGSFVYQRRSYR